MKQRIAWWLVLLPLFFFLLEGGARLYTYFHPLPASSPSLTTYRYDLLLTRLTWMQGIQPHPYFGYIRKEKQELIEQLPAARDPQQFKVLLLGGSLAATFNDVQERLFVTGLQKLPGLEKKKVILFNLAEGGYKQPQQYFLASYLLDKVDMIINIDGHNEMLGMSYFEEMVLPHEFPKFSFRYFSGVSSGLFYLFSANAIRQLYIWLDYLPTLVSPLTKSHAYYLLWDKMAPSFYDEFRHFGHEYEKSIAKELQRSGSLGKKIAPEELAQTWSKYLSLLATIAKSRETPFFSFLPPNQYLPGSKIFSEIERKVALRSEDEPESARRLLLLREEARSLAGKGMPVYDLMDLFSNRTDVLYIDDCCHMNDQGRNMVLEKILYVIAKKWRKD